MKCAGAAQCQEEPEHNLVSPSGTGEGLTVLQEGRRARLLILSRHRSMTLFCYI